LIANQAGTTVWRWDNTEPFGAALPNDDPGNTGNPFVFNLRFPGQYFDRETNLAYNNYRDYDPSIGRYVQSDLIGLAGGIDTYLYVGGNPLVFADPSGLDNPGLGPYGPYWSQPPFTYNRSDPVDPNVERQVECMSTCLGTRLVITGGREPGHDPGGRHPPGQAIDFGAFNNPTITPNMGRRGDALQCACNCKFTHGGWEPDWRPGSAPHYHFQNGLGARIPPLNCNPSRCSGASPQL
jgi:RHS repeat-associated protein